MDQVKTALVTGGNRGIGFEVCRQLAIKGLRVFLAARNRAAGVAACEKLGDLPVSFIELDMTSAASIETAAGALAKQTNHLDVLVHNAGICEDAEASILEVPEKTVRRTFDTNTLGPILLTQKLWPLIARSKAGRIINVSSGLGSLSQMSSGYPGYRLSKAALNAFTRILAAELAPHKVAVNSVSPGWVRTDMGGPDATSSVEEGADSILWLATEAPQSLTGEFIADRQRTGW